MHVLIVEDDPEINQLLCEYAQIAGFRTRSALSGTAALALATAEAPNLVLLDLMLPDIDGFEVLRRLKRDPALAHVPVVFLTALTAEDSRAQGRALGAVDYLTKPFDPDELLAVMHRHAR